MPSQFLAHIQKGFPNNPKERLVRVSYLKARTTAMEFLVLKGYLSGKSLTLGTEWCGDMALLSKYVPMK